jgi:hypothetical protein
MGNSSLTVRIPSELRQKLWTQLAMENNLTQCTWMARPLTFSDLVRELLDRGLADRLREINNKTGHVVGATLTSKPGPR